METDFKNMKCIGVLGGTFNPVHKGHLMMAECALREKTDIERIIFMPNNLPAYKNTQDITKANHRVCMLEAALQGHDNMCISQMELSRGGITYTADTLREILDINPGLIIYFIIGSDSLESLHLWFQYREILKMCRLLVAVRDTKRSQMETCAKRLQGEVPEAQIEFLDNQEILVSSTDIRAQISSGFMPYASLPQGVAEYIQAHRLFGWIAKS